MNRLLKLMLAVASTALMAACGGSDDDPPPAPGTIAEVAQEQGFSALVAAAAKADLVDTLADDAADLTVFAPTDAAFAELAAQLGFADAAAMVEALPADALRSILSYHVLAGGKTAADLAAGDATQPTLHEFDGTAAALALDTGDGVEITDAALTTATVVTPDVAASNGVVHAIDKVLVPPGVLTVVQMAQVNPQFSTLVQAVVDADLAGTLSGTGPYTVFAPVNDAFAAIAGTVATLTPGQLSTVLTYHVVAGEVLAAGIPFGAPVPTLAAQSITIDAGTPPTIADTTATPAAIVATDVRASNGVIHVIDKVLIPAL
jgi:transforming growth factor-beta-induced protein